MSDDVLYRYRVTYTKDGRLALLSHLEVAHTLERIVRRAGLPFAITQGFSPHMRIAFGTALPVGVGGTSEIFDLVLTQDLEPEDVCEALQQMSPANLYCRSVERITSRDPAATIAYPFSVYDATLPADAAGVLPDEWIIPESVIVARENKTKTYPVADYLCGRPVVRMDGGYPVIHFALEVKTTGSLRPDLFLRELFQVNNLALEPAAIMRVAQLAHLPESEPAIG